ncbi:hypothetical protein SLEP1_g26255 [Rubroshorea leprosula]|uniref:Uncharacterized protein n=1 Tax=Rubroshorea leprosula TaxID=152421 RepID=A0AAV5JSR2_9ROSI|nr:hypothetical protein SLEP1_g26255 [Rubroshorea leprosula]
MCFGQFVKVGVTVHIGLLFTSGLLFMSWYRSWVLFMDTVHTPRANN